MSGTLDWLAVVLREAGLKVAEQPGWLTRSRGRMGDVRGVMLHHTGTPNPRRYNMPTLRVLTEGVVQSNNRRIPGPLAHLGLGLDGTYYVIAAGRCNHAGSGEWRGITMGNSHFIGIEADHPGTASEPWPDVQLDAYRRGVAALLKHAGLKAHACMGHKEYAPSRKIDPISIDLDHFRSDVAALMAGRGVIRHPVIPSKDAKRRPTLRRGSRGPAVRIVQREVGVNADGIFGPQTEAAVRAFQLNHGLVNDGIVGPKTWQSITKADEANGLATIDPSSPDVGSETTKAPNHPQPARLAWGSKVSAHFRSKVVDICARLEADPNDLMACIAFETGETFSPSILNRAGSGATGLIQFMPTTAEDLNTTTAALADMSAEEQLDFVEAYFRRFRGKLNSICDLCMAILWPREVGKADDFALFIQGHEPIRVYDQNKGLDLDKDGEVTREEACAKVVTMLERGLTDEFLFVRD